MSESGPIQSLEGKEGNRKVDNVPESLAKKLRGFPFLSSCYDPGIGMMNWLDGGSGTPRLPSWDMERVKALLKDMIDGRHEYVKNDVGSEFGGTPKEDRISRARALLSEVESSGF